MNGSNVVDVSGESKGSSGCPTCTAGAHCFMDELPPDQWKDSEGVQAPSSSQEVAATSRQEVAATSRQEVAAFIDLTWWQLTWWKASAAEDP